MFHILLQAFYNGHIDVANLLLSRGALPFIRTMVLPAGLPPFPFPAHGVDQVREEREEGRREREKRGEEQREERRHEREEERGEEREKRYESKWGTGENTFSINNE